MDQNKRFPLGGSVYAYVNTRSGDTKIHIRHFVSPSVTKGGSVVPSVRGVKMDLQSFMRLCRMKKNIKTEYINDSLKADEKRRRGGGKVRKERKPRTDVLYQRRTDVLPPPPPPPPPSYLSSSSPSPSSPPPMTFQNEGNQHDPNCPCFQLVSPTTPRYPAAAAPTSHHRLQANLTRFAATAEFA